MYIRTSRLIIRDYLPSDWQDLHQIFSDPEVMKNCEHPYSEAQTKSALDLFIRTSIGYAVTLSDSGKVIGHVLLHQLPSEESGIYEIGWFFHRSYWRKGYAYEACRALIEHGFHEWKLHKICAETLDPVKSVCLMRKLGMSHEGTFHSHAKHPDGHWADVYWYGICNPTEETQL